MYLSEMCNIVNWSVNVTALTDDCTTYELVVHWLFAFSASEAELGPQHVRTQLAHHQTHRWWQVAAANSAQQIHLADKQISRLKVSRLKS